MPKTSFGEMEILLRQGTKPQVEYLKFTTKGRPHRHAEFESFFTVNGSGRVIMGEESVAVQPGDLITIPPDVSHWMDPDEGAVLEGLLWYHEVPLTQLK